MDPDRVLVPEGRKPAGNPVETLEAVADSRSFQEPPGGLDPAESRVDANPHAFRPCR
jgi:hypothetical protein